MKRGIAIGYALGLVLTGAVIAWAQGGGCGQGNPNCVVPTPPVSDNSNRAANTSWVNQLFSGGLLNPFFNTLTASAIVDSKLTTPGSICNSSTGIFFSTSSGFCPGQGGSIIVSSISFSPTVSGIVGTTAGDNANPGVVGEYISQAVLQASSLTLSSGLPKSISSITLTAGDWDIEGHCDFNLPSGSATVLICSISSLLNALAIAPNNGGYAQIQGVTITGSANEGISTGRQRLNLTSASTIYFTAEMVSTASPTAWGFIGARRMR